MNSEDMIPTSGNFQDPDTHEVLWKELEKTAYERIITSQYDFVKFMQSMHVPDDAVLFPPEDGWPEITKESFAPLGKSDEIVEVLRNMAYIKGPMGASPREILTETSLMDWRQPSFVRRITSGQAEEVLFFTEPVNEPAPPEFVGLTIGGTQCAMIMLDCRYGIVRWLNCGEGVTEFGGMTKGDRVDSGDPMWGGDTAWPVEEFFEYIKAKFVNLEQLAFNQSRVIKKDNVSSEPIYDFDFFKEVYQRYGWPGADYDKDACMREVTEHCEEHCIN